MKKIILSAISLILFHSGKTQSNEQFKGTWFRYGKTHKLVEIFVQKNNGDFISTGFNEKGVFSNLEKGTYEIKGDSIYFKFNYAAEVTKEGAWTILSQDKLNNAHYKYQFKNKNSVTIGIAQYYRE